MPRRWWCVAHDQAVREKGTLLFGIRLAVGPGVEAANVNTRISREGNCATSAQLEEVPAVGQEVRVPMGSLLCRFVEDRHGHGFASRG